MKLIQPKGARGSCPEKLDHLNSDTTLSTTSVASLNGGVSSLNGTTWDSSGGTPDNALGPVDFIYDAGDTTFVTNKTLGTLRNNLGGWVGMKITTNSQPIKVRSLGRIFTTGNNQNHTVKIVKVSDNSTVASVPISMTGGIDGQFKYATPASSVILEANTSYYVVSQEAKNKDQWYDSDTFLSTTTAATVNGRVSSNNGNTWDISGGIVNRSYGPVDIVYETNDTPLGVDLKNKIDFGNVGLMGHSRGGEGVRAAYNLYNKISGPWSKTSGRIRDAMTIKGIFEFAPTDRTVATPFLDGNNLPWAVVLPACDGDVLNLQGVKPFDRMLRDSTEIDTAASLKATYFVYGANHNFYNTQWQVSDSASCEGTDNNSLFATPTSDGMGGFGSASQRKSGLSAFLAFFRSNVGSTVDVVLNQNFDPRFELPTSVSSITKIKRGFTVSPSTSKTQKFNALAFTGNQSDICAFATVVCSDNSPLTLQATAKQVQLAQSGFLEHDDDFFAASISWYSAGDSIESCGKG